MIEVRDHMPHANTLLYLCYGSSSVYDQALYSILSALRFSGDPPRDFRIAVYCDRPEAFADLPVTIVRLDQETLDRWMGTSDYIHRRKTCAVIDAFERFGGKVIFVDSDTYFTKSPVRIFERVGPGRVCFHICEGYLRSTGTQVDMALAAQLDRHGYRLPTGEQVVVTRRTAMWNTGVVGIDEADAGRIHDALVLSDAIWADADPNAIDGKKIHHAEQFAMGYVFGSCRLSEADDCLYHYWRHTAKYSFGEILPELVRRGIEDRSPENLAALYARRYRETGSEAWKDWFKMKVRAAALALGIPVRGVRRSVI